MTGSDCAFDERDTRHVPAGAGSCEIADVADPPVHEVARVAESVAGEGLLPAEYDTEPVPDPVRLPVSVSQLFGSFVAVTVHVHAVFPVCVIWTDPLPPDAGIEADGVAE